MGTPLRRRARNSTQTAVYKPDIYATTSQYTQPLNTSICSPPRRRFFRFLMCRSRSNRRWHRWHSAIKLCFELFDRFPSMWWTVRTILTRRMPSVSGEHLGIQVRYPSVGLTTSVRFGAPHSSQRFPAKSRTRAEILRQFFGYKR